MCRTLVLARLLLFFVRGEEILRKERVDLVCKKMMESLLTDHIDATDSLMGLQVHHFLVSVHDILSFV